MKPPYLSIIVTSRNDNHGENLLARTQLFVDVFVKTSCQFNLNSELIIVEWNPPPDKPKLAEIIEWPDKTGPCSVRIIEVPPDLHQRYQYSDKLFLFQMIAKNVGIKRAKGKFVLATNIDIIFSEQLIQYFASRKLDPRRMYRIDRFDVANTFSEKMTVREILEYCNRNIFRIYNIHGVWEFTPGKYGYIKQFSHLLKAYAQRATSVLKGRGLPIPNKKLPIHSNACGDFTLMAIENWKKVRGYPEFEMYSMNMDSFLCYAAHYLGIEQTVLKRPKAIYHIEHSSGSGWSPGKGGQLLFERLKKMEVPWLDWDDCVLKFEEMSKGITPDIYNKNENWGLVDVNLPQEVII